mgnify:CR=1 FL=1
MTLHHTRPLGQFFIGVGAFFTLVLFSFFGAISFNAQAQSAPDNMAGLQTSFAPVIKNVGPAVVNLSTKKVVQKRVSPFANDPFFKMFFGNMMPGLAQERVESSLGSGVIVRSDGLFVTNYHVIKGATEVKVLLPDNREFTAKLVDADPQFDLAVMQIDTKGESLPYAEFGDADALKVGDIALAIGNPFGVGQSVSMGIISALGRSGISNTPMGDFIQTDAAINPGNSGGPLVNAKGKVVGINSAIFTRSGGSNGIGFAVPANVVKSVVDSVIETGEVQRGWFGAAGQDVNQVLADNLGLDRPMGVLINEIAPESPAARAGLQIGDIILKFDGNEVPNARALKSRIASTPVNTEATMTIWRSGSLRDLELKLAPPPERRESDALILKGAHPLKNHVVEQLTPFIAQQLGLKLSTKGVVVAKVPRSGFGLQPGDVIEAINGKKIEDLADIKQTLSGQNPSSWEIVYRRGDRRMRLRLN